jgi:hypothetical protein
VPLFLGGHEARDLAYTFWPNPRTNDPMEAANGHATDGIIATDRREFDIEIGNGECNFAGHIFSRSVSPGPIAKAACAPEPPPPVPPNPARTAIKVNEMLILVKASTLSEGF